MINLTIYSPNMLKTFEECPQKFFLKYIERMSLPQRSTIFEKGKKIHALANYYLNGENIEKMEKTLNTDEKLAWEALKSNEYFKLNVFNTEYNLSCKVDKYWIGGRLDALMFDGENANNLMENGKWKMENEAVSLRGVNEADDAAIQKYPSPEFLALVPRTEILPSPARGEGETAHLSPLTSHFFILDYKTGNLPQNAEQDFQTIVYLLAADKFLNRKSLSNKGLQPFVCENLTGGYNSLKFVYLGLKEDKQKEIILTPELKKQYEEKIVETCKKIDSTASSNTFTHKKERCQNCEYAKFCSN